MRKSLFSVVDLDAHSISFVSLAKQIPAKAVASDCSISTNVAYTSDYYVHGLSQNIHKQALQAGFDVQHSYGSYAGSWASIVSPNTFPEASLEIDYDAVFGGEFGKSCVGYSAGVITYTYPSADWDNCGNGDVTGGDFSNGAGAAPAEDNSWNTHEANLPILFSTIPRGGKNEVYISNNQAIQA